MLFNPGHITCLFWACVLISKMYYRTDMQQVLSKCHAMLFDPTPNPSTHPFRLQFGGTISIML